MLQSKSSACRMPWIYGHSMRRLCCPTTLLLSLFSIIGLTCVFDVWSIVHLHAELEMDRATGMKCKKLKRRFK